MFFQIVEKNINNAKSLLRKQTHNKQYREEDHYQLLGMLSQLYIEQFLIKIKINSFIAKIVFFKYFSTTNSLPRKVKQRKT